MIFLKTWVGTALELERWLPCNRAFSYSYRNRLLDLFLQEVEHQG
jgi:hypothetical protein